MNYQAIPVSESEVPPLSFAVRRIVALIGELERQISITKCTWAV
jgi:hypothetical protein